MQLSLPVHSTFLGGRQVFHWNFSFKITTSFFWCKSPSSCKEEIFCNYDLQPEIVFLVLQNNTIFWILTLPWSVVSCNVGVTDNWVTNPGLKSISLRDMIGWSIWLCMAILYPSPKITKLNLIKKLDFFVEMSL